VGTNLPAATKGWHGQATYIDAGHRVHARVEDSIRTGKQTGISQFPSHDYKLNQAWPTAAMMAQILLAWLKLLALDGDLAKAEPKTLRVLNATARLVRGGRRRWKFPPAGRGPSDHPGLAADQRTTGHRLTSMDSFLRPVEGTPGARGTPGTRPASRAIVHIRTLKSPLSPRSWDTPRQPATRMNDQG